MVYKSSNTAEKIETENKGKPSVSAASRDGIGKVQSVLG